MTPVVDLAFWGPVTQRSFRGELELELRDRSAASRDPEAAVHLAYQLPARAAAEGRFAAFRELWRSTGVTAGQLGIAVGSERALLDSVAHVTYVLDRLPWMRKALTADDIRYAAEVGEHAVFLQCQPVEPISRDLGLLERAIDFGLRVLMLTYNEQDHVGTGCLERHDSGLSRFGLEVVSLLNTRGVAVDTAHCGRRTTLDACAASAAPVIASHTAARAVHDHPRCKSDEEIRAIAETGGVVGVVTAPFFLGDGQDASLDDVGRHVAYIAELVGVEHVAIGTDWPPAGPPSVMEGVVRWALQHGFRSSDGVTSTTLTDFADYLDFPRIGPALIAHGFSADEVAQVVGGNAVRVFEKVWG